MVMIWIRILDLMPRMRRGQLLKKTKAPFWSQVYYLILQENENERGVVLARVAPAVAATGLLKKIRARRSRLYVVREAKNERGVVQARRARAVVATSRRINPSHMQSLLRTLPWQVLTFLSSSSSSSNSRSNLALAVLGSQDPLWG
jgi:hypothetical protein